MTANRSRTTASLWAWLTICLCLAIAPATADLDPNFAETIDAYASELVEKERVPGISIAVAHGGEVLFARGYGYANLDDETPAAPDTIYRIGSITKQFTAAAIMQLVEKGLLRLDDPLTTFFPEYPDPGAEVTVQHLLHHTAGMKSFTGLDSYIELMAEAVTHETLIARFIDLPFDFQPGERYQYNNSAYYLLGFIIENVSGQSYDAYLKEHIFAPAGLNDTAYGTDGYPTPRHAVGYKREDKAFHEDAFLSMTQPFSAGALVSTVEDLMRWQAALRSGDVVSHESYYLMTTKGRVNSGAQFDYGFGLSISTDDWRHVVQHGGGINGFRSTLDYYPDEDVAIAILTNTVAAPAGQFAKRIAKDILVEPTARRLDTIIEGGAVIDGTGRERVQTDIGIKDGTIVAIGELDDKRAKTRIDAKDLVVAPGFIDVHNHSETGIASKRHKLNEGFVRQGVTTIVGGADGSLGPANIRALMAKYEDHGIATNVAFYVGHNAIRRTVLGAAQRREPDDTQLSKMRALVREGMELGAVGLSTGLMYEPGMFSTTDEVVALAREVTPYGGIYDSHVRDPVRAFLASHAEAAEIGRKAGIPSKLGHLKGVGLENKGVIDDIIAMVERERAAGHVVVSDQYPYDGAATSLLRNIVIVPKSTGNGKGDNLKALLADTQKRAAIRTASENGVDGGFAWLKATGYSAMRIVSSEDYPDLVGSYLSELAEERSVEPFDLVCDLILGAESTVLITLGAIKEEDVRKLLAQPWNIVASDGSYTDSEGKSAQSHPRSTGTFPRVLGHYVRDEGVLTLEDAIRKMTWLPARHLGLRDRGRIALGLPADIVVFDPYTIAAKSTWDEPGIMPVGVQHVFVNGDSVLRDGKLTGKTPGQLVKPRTH